jgi:hypothetical protein
MRSRRAAALAGLSAALLLVAGCRGERTAAAAGYEGPFADEVREAIPKIERVSRVPFRTPPKVEARSSAEVRAFLERQFEEENTANELTGQSAAYKRLGLIDDTLDVRRLLLDLLTEQIVGFYDPDTKVLYVVESAPPDMRKTIIEHELIHALQDQYVDLDSLRTLTHGNNDLASAVQAVTEGQAVYEQLEANLGLGDIAARLPGGWDRVRTEIRRNSTNMPLFSTAPLLFQETLLFPYLSGAEFVRRAKLADSLPVAEMRLPVSTEQVMHAEAYAGEPDAPTRLELPPPAAGDVVYQNNLGEFETRLLLYAWSRDQAAAVRGAAGWDGDRYVLFRTPDGDAIAWLTLWDTAVDAGEFFDVMNDALARRFRDLRSESLGAHERRYTGGGRAMRMTASEVQGRPAVLFVDLPRGGRTDAVLDLSAVRLTEQASLATPRPAAGGRAP